MEKTDTLPKSNTVSHNLAECEANHSVSWRYSKFARLLPWPTPHLLIKSNQKGISPPHIFLFTERYKQTTSKNTHNLEIKSHSLFQHST